MTLVRAATGRLSQSRGSWAIVLTLLLAGLTGAAPQLGAQQAKTDGRMRIVFTSFHPTSAAEASVAAVVDPRLTTNLSQSDKIVVLERRRLDEALKALQIESSAIIDPNTAVKIGTFLGATHVTVGDVSRVANTVSINARTVAVDTSAVVPAASKTIDGAEADAFNLVDLLSSYMLKGLTGESRTFTENVLEHEFTIKPPRFRPTGASLSRPCEPILQKATPSITIGCIIEYYPPSGPMDLVRGVDKVKKVDITVNNEVVASFGAQASDSSVEMPLNLDIGPAKVITQVTVDVAQSDIKRVPVSIIREVKGKIRITMQR